MNKALMLPYANEGRKERINCSSGTYVSGILISGEPFEVIKESDPNAIIGGLIEVSFNDGSNIWNYSFFRPMTRLTHKLESISFSKKPRRKYLGKYFIINMKDALVVDYTRKSISLVQERIEDIYKMLGKDFKKRRLYEVVDAFLFRSVETHVERILKGFRNNDLLLDKPTNPKKLENILEDLHYKGTAGIRGYEPMIQSNSEVIDYFVNRKFFLTRL